MRWRYRNFTFSDRMNARRRLGIPTESIEELREPLAVDEYMALIIPTTSEFIMDKWDAV